MNLKSLTVHLILMVSLMPGNLYSEGEFRAGIGAGTFLGSLEFNIAYRPENSHWLFGFAQMYNESEQHISYRVEEEETYVGPLVKYLFTPEDIWSFYAGAGLLRFELVQTVDEISESDSASTSGMYLGGGYTRRFGRQDNFFFDIGFFVDVTNDVLVETSVSSTEMNGFTGGFVVGVSAR